MFNTFMFGPGSTSGPGGFENFSQSFNSGSGTVIIPYGATQCALYAWGQGGSGGAGHYSEPGGEPVAFQGGGGGGGGYCTKTIAISSGDWGSTISYNCSTTTAQIDSTGLSFGTVNMDANPGGTGGAATFNSHGSGASGGTASGGTSNVTGSSGLGGGSGGSGGSAANGGGGGSGGSGGNNGDPGGVPGGGGGGGGATVLTGGSAGSGGSGGARQVTFSWS